MQESIPSPCWKCSPYPDCHNGCPILASWRQDKARRKVFLIFAEILTELSEAEGKHAPMQSKAHGYGVIREEYCEFEREVFAEKTEGTNEAMRHELIQLAAMAVRFLKDLS